jgi:UDP-glucuronate 4-epimerase
MRILITGTAGFIGFHLAKKLLEHNFEIIGLDNINDYYDINLKYNRLKETGIFKEDIIYNKLIKSKKYKKYNFIKLNLEDKENLNDLFKNENIDIICNLAAQAGVRYSLTNPDAYINSNIVGFLNIIECARNYNIKLFVYASSSSVYGKNTKTPFSEQDNVDKPLSLYAASKKSNELIAHAYSHLYNIPTVGLRFFSVYGPWGRPDMALYIFTKAILENKPIDLFNNGDMRRSFTYIDDIIDGIKCIIDNSINLKNEHEEKKYKIYNIGNNTSIKLMELIRLIEKNLNKIANKTLLPLQSGDVQETYSDTIDFYKDYNYVPSTPIKEGINNFILWYKKYLT